MNHWNNITPLMRRSMVCCALLAQPRGLYFTCYAASISPVMLETSVAQ